MSTAWIGLGANLGDPPATFRNALDRLDALESVAVRSVSPVYRTAPWGRGGQPDFLNAVAGLETQRSPQALLAALLAIETDLGRVRDGERWGPRKIDLDLLVFGDRVVDEPGLRLPHPRLIERAFVLIPLADLAPDLVVPGAGRVDECLAALDDKQLGSVRPAEPLDWTPAGSSPRT